MDESEDNLSSEDMKSSDSPLTVKSKPKKRSLIERELETSLTAMITSPVTLADGTSTSRYVRARRSKGGLDQPDSKKVSSELKSPLSDQTPIKAQPQSPVYKMHASNSPVRRKKTATKPVEQLVDNQIESIYQENISLSRFTTEEINTATLSPTKKFPKVYIRKDLIQKREPEETVLVIQNIFSPGKSGKKTSSTHLNNILERSSERYTLSSKPSNGYLDNSSVVKTLDFDGSKKKKRESKDVKNIPTKSELFDLEAKCEFQVGDLAWARMGTFPFWPSIVTRESSTGLFVKKKLCGRVEHDVIHVIFFGDNGRHAWVMDNMLMKYLGQLEFETARQKFTPEAKKKDRSLYAAYFVSEKKQHLWNASVEEAEMLLREPKRLRIDLFNEILLKARSTKVKQPKSKISRTDSDVSLSESLYDSLFSEDDGKIDNNDRSKIRSRNKSLDMFEVVTACLDNMAAKTGITKIQRQSHMDRWLQKAKSKTPEKTKAVTPVKKIEKVEEKKQTKPNGSKKKKHTSSKTPAKQSYRLRKSNSRNHVSQNENDYTKTHENCIVIDSDYKYDKADTCNHVATKESSGIGFIIKVESLADDKFKKSEDNEMIDDSSVSMESLKDKSINMNDTCESETYTDSNSSTNNNIIDEDKNESQDRNESVMRKDLKENSVTNSDAAENMGPLSNNIDPVVENIERLIDKPDSGVESPKTGASGDTGDIDLLVKHTEKQCNVKLDNAMKINKATKNEIQFQDSREPEKLISPELNEDTIALNSEDNIKCHETSEPEEPISNSELEKDSLNSNLILDDKDNHADNKNEEPISNSELQSENDSVQSHDSSLHNEETSTEYTNTTSNTASNTVSQNTGVDESSIETDINTSQHIETAMQDPEFIKYLELRQDALIDENPDLTQNEIIPYLYKTWLYEENKSDVSLDTSSNIHGVKNIVSSTPEKTEDYTINAHAVHARVTNEQEAGKEVASAQEIKELETSAPETKSREISAHEVDNRVTDQGNNQEIEVPLMYDDSDSESERLPYSPLSNLGNNSDDDLANEPLKDDKTREVENQKLSAAIEENRYKIDNIDHRPKENEVYNIVRNHELTKSQYESMDVDDTSMKHKIVENGHISDDKYTHNKENNSYKEHKIPEKSECINNAQINDLKTHDVVKSVPCNGYRGQNVREIEMSAKELRIYVTKCPDFIKQNGIHNINGDCDIETASIHSEDSLASTKSETRPKLRSKQDKKLENPMENPEFVKYMELRQDAIMDENPELNEKEIVAYLHKTWLYEESDKSDVKKSEDLKELNLVKGMNQPQVESLNRNKKKLSLARNKSTKTSNTLQRFWRRKNEVEHNNDKKDSEDGEEIFPRRRRSARKYIQDDDEDDDLDAGEDELLKSPSSSKTNSNLSKSETSEEKLNKGDLPNGDVLEPTLKHPMEKTVQLVNGDITQQNLEIFNDNEGRINKDISSEIDKKESTKSLYISSKSDSKFAKTDDELCAKNDNRKETQKLLSMKPSSMVGISAPVMVEAITKLKDEGDADSIDSEDSETPLIRCKLRSKAKKEIIVDKKIKDEELDTISINSEDSEVSVTKRKKRFGNKTPELAYEDPEFVKYFELRRDALIDENPQLTQNEMVAYLYKTWLYEENLKSDIRKTDDIEQSTLVKGLNDGVQTQPKKVKRKVMKTEKAEKDSGDDDSSVKEKPKRKSVKPFYNEEYSDIEEELEVFEIFKPKVKATPKIEPGLSVSVTETERAEEVVEVYDEVELYFAELTKPKPNIFKGLIREKVCEICENLDNLVKCKGCNGMFHVDCVKRQMEVVEVQAPTRARKKRKGRPSGRKPKSSGEFDTDDRSQDASEDNNASIDEIIKADPHTVDAEALEAQLTAKMKEILDSAEKIDYDSYSSDDGLDWNETVPGKCEIVDIKLKPRRSIYEIDYADFKCNNCQSYNTPVCFVCKGAVSKKDSTKRQKCHVAHCQKYYHLECLDQWPQTQFNGGEPSKNNKKISEYFEALTCPRHVCHTCVSDDPRGCKTRFSGDKLARCVRCPATYHSFTKCLPAGTQILTASHIICPRHYEHRPGKVPCHVNTGWCFICALGGSLICCEYCPTSFHAECLNIDPPEGGYMCEDCETGRLPLYGEMVWVKLGHYRWWPGIVLHPYEIPENLMAIKHSIGEFVVRFFGQYDHYWVNRGRVFPFQEGDSGRVSSQRSKIDAAFTTAMEHAQRACEILKTAKPNEEESLDIQSSLLPPHYVKLKVNKPCGSLIGKKLEDPENSLTQCECNPNDGDPCGPYSQCLNRMLLTECGPTCRAGDRCNNRAFEKRLYPKLTPYRTPSRGWGLKTLEDIKAGQFVIEYVGELIDEEETRRRMRRKHEIRDENFYFLTLDKERMIDAGPKGNLARFMNHCCEPNCETQKWTVLGDVRVGLFALYDIPAHSEVTFNYNLECAGIDKKRCMCGAKRCSGYIGAKPKQDESQSKKNKLQPTKRAYKKRKPEESPSTKNKPKRPIGRPPKPKELTEIEKDLLIIQSATSALSSDESSRISSEFEKNPKALKRKRVSFSAEEVVYDAEPSVKKVKLDSNIEGD